MWGKSTSINLDQTTTDYGQQQPDRAVKNLKDGLSALKYHQDPTIGALLVNQANRVGNMFNQMETNLVAQAVVIRSTIYRPSGKCGFKSRADRARTSADTHLTENLKKLKAGYTDSDY